MVAKKKTKKTDTEAAQIVIDTLRKDREEEREREKKSGPSNGALITLTVLAVILVTVLIVVGWVWGSYNTFVVARQDIETQFSNIKTEYQRRADLFYNMAEVAKGYAGFEKETMIQVTEARAGAFGSTKEEQMQNMNSLDSAISRLAVVFEKYPELKTIEQYNKLSEEVQRTENRIQIARSDYNTLVRSYNILIMSFPRNMIAPGQGFVPEAFFTNEAGTTTAPKLDMGE